MYLFDVRTARLFGTASAAAAGRFLHGFGCLVCCLLGGLFLGLFLQFLFGERCCILGRCSGLLYCLFSATCAGFSSTSAASRISRLVGANCAGFIASAAVACRMGARQGNASRTDQAGDAQTGKEFFQILAIHRFPPL
jgi:hypothetical protein